MPSLLGHLQPLLSPLQRTYSWGVLFPDIGEISGANVSKYCQDISFGEYSMSELSIMKHGPYQAFYAGPMQINSITATFVVPSASKELDISSLSSIVSKFNIFRNFIDSWRELIIDVDGYYSVKSRYQKNIYVFFEDTTGIAFDTFVLKKAFPKTFPTYALAYSNEDILKVSLEFSIDGVEKQGFPTELTSHQALGRLPQKTPSLGISVPF